ncbi:MAG: RsiV family protein, partial [Clostridiales bacterium]|nr:RsiV family protein [Clostridiales bacterium]
MRILGLLGFCLFTFLMPLSFGNNVYAQNQYSVTDRSVEIVSGIAEVSGVLPEVAFSSFSARSFADEINNAVNAEFEKIVSSTAGKKAKISFSYEIKEYNDIVSLLLKSDVTVVSVQNAVSTFNFNPTLRRFVTISDVDVLGVNGAELVNSALSEEIKRDVDKYKANFKGINDGQDFFVEDGTVYVVFDKDEIAYGFAGVIYFPIKIADV